MFTVSSDLQVLWGENIAFFFVLLMLFRCVTKQLFISTMTPIIRCRNTSSAISLALLLSPSVVFNLTMNDKRQSPVYNVIMWACLFLGQGVQVCLYCQEWYAQKHCPRTGVRTSQQRNAMQRPVSVWPIWFPHLLHFLCCSSMRSFTCYWTGTRGHWWVGPWINTAQTQNWDFYF